MHFYFNNKNINILQFKEINPKTVNNQVLHLDLIPHKSINLTETINKLNLISFITPENNQSCPIYFENFTAFSKLKNKIFQHNTNESLFYSFEKKSIYLYQDIFNQKNQENNPHSFSTQLLKKINPETFASIVLLHEIGHAIHHALWAESVIPQRILVTSQDDLKTKFLNSFINSEHVIRNSNNEIKFNHASIKNHYRTIIQENFADLFAIIALNTIIPDKKQALDLSEKIYEAREHAKNYNQEDYDTYQNIHSVIDDLKNGKNFTHFEDIQNYIAERTSQVVLKQFEQDINHHPKAKEEMPFYLGMINQKMDWKKSTLNEVVAEINQQFNLSCSLLTFDSKVNYSETVENMNNKFTQSQQQKMFLEKNTAINHLQKIRQQALEPIASCVQIKAKI
jgi:hypothetical protein